MMRRSASPHQNWRTDRLDGIPRHTISTAPHPTTPSGRVFACPDCGKEIVFHSEALDEASGRVRDAFCFAPIVKKDLGKKDLERIREGSVYDPVTKT
jgi:hypothetical protein